ncbi:MAG TPA: YdeI/OmpD-associated family protein [Chitinophagaceae bacterium]|nr:YdeI/OmpD-associated family protein [Chitinophagaceae bacterium]
MKKEIPIPVKTFKTRQKWLDWLHKNHEKQEGLWVRIAKKGSQIPTVTYAEALETALCYGWIDGQKKPLDEDYWLQRFTPRRRNSIWSRVNCQKAEQLILDGKMHAAGLKAVDLARKDGRWDRAYESQSKATPPEDLLEALEKNPAAKAFFAGLDRINRYAILFRIHNTKGPEKRAAKLAQLVDQLARQKKIHS